MIKLILISIATVAFSAAAHAQSTAPISPESKTIMDKMKVEKQELNVLAQCLPGLKRCNGGGSHGGNMSVCCKESDTCGQTPQGIPYCR
jgi:hypothetical protein